MAIMTTKKMRNLEILPANPRRRTPEVLAAAIITALILLFSAAVADARLTSPVVIGKFKLTLHF